MCVRVLFVSVCVCVCCSPNIYVQGNTNGFEVNRCSVVVVVVEIKFLCVGVKSYSQRALMHNDNAVLENHHAYTTFQILRVITLVFWSP